MKQIQLGGRNNTQIKGYTLVDDDIFDELNKYNWCFDGKYVSRTVKGEKIKMHRVIMNPQKGMQVDHIDGNKLNNQRQNLRICTNAQNSRNRRLRSDNKTGFKGVFWRERDKVFTAYITYNQKNKHLGTFRSAVEAAKVYNNAAIEYFGEFAYLNRI